MEQKKKVFVGMSGGVDSSVSAALLKEAGYEVVGVFIKVWQADFLPCTWREERREAMRVAGHLGIPFLTLNLEKEYKQEVVDYMIREYSEGRIPNPDIMCNKYVKFGAFFDFARAHGADFIATGHYAQIVEEDNRKLTQTKREPTQTKVFKLLKSEDNEKDQTYFLWTLTERELAHTLFPIGHLKKSEVRVLAEKFGLPNADKKDSQGICFIGMVDMADFLQHYLKTQKGDVLDQEGNVIGTHDGAMLYTIGQRRGFTVHNKHTDETPYFVITKNITANTITVAHHDSGEMQKGQSKIFLGHLNLRPHQGKLTARMRHRGELLPVTLEVNNDDNTQGIAQFETPRTDFAPGQSLVFYDGDECVGGAIIENFEDKPQLRYNYL